MESDLDLFLAYSTHDRDRVAEIKGHLDTRGLRVFLDVDDLPVGQRVSRHISQALRRARAVAVFISAHYNDNWYLDEEIHVAIAAHRAQGGIPALLPVMLDASEPPYGLSQLQSIDARGLTPAEIAARIARSLPDEGHEGPLEEATSPQGVDESKPTPTLRRTAPLPTLREMRDRGLSLIEHLGPGAIVRGLRDQPITVRESRWYSSDILRIDFEGGDGQVEVDFVDRSMEPELEIVGGTGHPMFPRYPAGVPRLFESKPRLLKTLAALHARGRLPLPVLAFTDRLCVCLSFPAPPTDPRSGPSHARPPEALLPTVVSCVLSDPDALESELAALEALQDPRSLKLAIVVDPEIDRALYDASMSRLKRSSLPSVLVSELMLQGSFERAVTRLLPSVAALEASGGRDELELVELGISPSCPSWGPIPDLPFGFGRRVSTLDDPVFYVDVFNPSDWQARVTAAWCLIRVNHPKAHGFFPEALLKPAATITLPIDPLGGAYSEAAPEYPVLVHPRCHQRIDIKLEGVGAALRGELNLGLRFGAGRSLRLPAQIVIT